MRIDAYQQVLGHSDKPEKLVRGNPLRGGKVRRLTSLFACNLKHPLDFFRENLDLLDDPLRLFGKGFQDPGCQIGFSANYLGCGNNKG